MNNQNTNNQVNVANLIGTWSNVNPSSDFIANLQINAESNLSLTIQFCSDERFTQQVFEITPLTTGEPGMAAGFYFQQAGSQLMIAANEKNGVLVLQCYRQGEDGKPNQLTREFYYKSDAEPSAKAKFNPDANNLDCQNAYVLDDFKSLTGTWRNTNENSQWVSELVIEQNAQGFDLLSHSNHRDLAWPQCQLTPYFLDHNEMGFVAHSRNAEQLTGESCQINSLFTAYSNKGLIVLSSFHQFSQSNELAVFNREFYAKQR